MQPRLRNQLCRTAPAHSVPCPTGTIYQLSDRPLLCASVDWSLGEAALGGSDHAVYIVDTASCKLKRTLFKQGGHAEWVGPCCAAKPQCLTECPPPPPPSLLKTLHS